MADKEVITNYLKTIILSVIIFAGCERPTNTDPGDDGIPPAVPSGLRVFRAGDGEIILDWSANTDPGLSGYNIFKRTEFTGPIQTGFTQNTYFFDDSLDYDTTYFYSISAIDIWGRESERTNEVSGKPINRFPPARPLGFNINARNWEGNVSINLSWYRNPESDIAGYTVHKSTNSGFEPDSLTKIGFTSDINFDDTSGIELNNVYYYKVRAIDKGGLISDPSVEKHDLVLDQSELIFPGDNQSLQYFRDFVILAVKKPATYKLIVQRNQFFDEFWTTEFSSHVVSDTIKVRFTPPYLEAHKKYYWRVVTYSGNSNEPNSISKLRSFTILP